MLGFEMGLILISLPIRTKDYRELQGWVLGWFGSLSDRELAIGLLTMHQLWQAARMSSNTNFGFFHQSEYA
jgi:hypothetical protein